ncbi:hypothetical protein [Bradyrhizobium vignae]|uniref:hypothetical protein n=1 Tax=Bradyrhizobium vignae TaxID=1549949 RepID=UPI00100B5674|nr:hypothetical protein [Bradyrhizobium vignae]RXG97197.1 hypothetical protein EAV90_22790 [Bradyrhizobium vignae]
MRHIFLICAVALSFVIHVTCALATPLSDALMFWEPPQALLCNATGTPYPTKYSAGDPTHCDDGDMTLFNGLLCAAGDGRGCEGVRLSQGADGRWWRSPRRIGWTYPNHDVSFSPDQALGVMLYAVATRDVKAFDRWLQWIADNRPCLIKVGSNCIKEGWLRYCTDDAADKRCTLRPGDCTYLKATANYLGSARARLCEDVIDDLAGAAPFPKNLILSVPGQALASATANTPGFPLHLASVGLFLARTMGLQDPDLDAAAKVLVAKQGENPFFQFLSVGKAQGVTDQLLALCPTQARPSGNRSQWAWERDQAEQAWKDSMYWDCIFLGKLQ